LSPPFEPLVHGSATIDGGREERPRLSKTRRGGHPTRGRPVPSRHCRLPCPSSSPAPCPRLGPDHRRCHPPLPPARAKPRPPRLVPHLRPPHPCQELRKPPHRPPLPLLLMATTTPTTSTASKPRGNCRRRTTGRGLPSPRCRRPCHPGRGGGEGAEHSSLLLSGSRSRSVRRWFPCRRHRRWGLGGGGGARGGGCRARRQRQKRQRPWDVVMILLCCVFGWWRRLTGREWIFLLKCQKIQRM
jgi:hypothetical protein